MDLHADPTGAYWEWKPTLPANVRLDASGLLDEDAGARLPLEGPELAVLGALDGRATLRDLEQHERGAASFLFQLNRAHLVNLVRGPRERWGELWALSLGSDHQTPRVCERISVSGKSAHGVLLAVFRGTLSHMLSTPFVSLCWLGALVLTLIAAVRSGPLMIWIALFGYLGYMAHECGHACASLWFSEPTYISASSGGVNVHARLSTSWQSRVFAIAGPLTPAAMGLLVLVVHPWGNMSDLVAMPLLAHLVFLAPPFNDGLVLLRGKPPCNESPTGVSL